MKTDTMGMRVLQLSRPGTPLKMVNRIAHRPGPGQVLLRASARGLSHG